MPEANTSNSPYAADCILLEDLAKEAGSIALRYFGEDPQVWLKEGQSPVSEADFAVDAFLKEKLLEARPDYGWLSEETDDDEARLETQRCFVVDPIDGTRGFLNHSKQWCVSIAIVENNRPIAGVLECPALQQTLTAQWQTGAYLNGERLVLPQDKQRETLRISGPRSLAKQAITSIEGTQQPTIVPFIPSLAYRIALVAMNELEGALARGSAKDWDLAAADLIAHEAGAVLTDIAGETLRYNCKDIRHSTLVAAHPAHHNELLDLARRNVNKPA